MLWSERVSHFASTHPDRVAIEEGSSKHSFGSLEREAWKMATRLRSELGTRGERVGLMFTGAYQFAVALLGSIRAGMVAVAIDPSYPEDRVEVILEDSGCSLMLTDCPRTSRTVPVLESARLLTEPGPDEPLPSVDPSAVSRLVYTSGSMGLPKATIRSESSVAASEINALATLGDVTLDGRWVLFFSGSTGANMSVLSAPMCFGGTAVIYDVPRLGVTGIGVWLRDHAIAVLLGVPTLLRILCDEIEPDAQLPDLLYLFIWGENLRWADVQSFRRVAGTRARIYNCYGASETGMVAMFEIPDGLPQEGLVPVGWPVPGAQVRITDDNGNPVPRGDAGEIVVRGELLPLGYWNRPALTESIYGTDADGRRTCRTGDRGRLLPDGSLELMGRLDRVVKISGRRVDLEEVEDALAKLPGVSGAAVAVIEDSAGNDRLVGFAVPAGADPVLEPLVLRFHLSRRLPGFMLPDQILLRDSLPTLTGGKLDRRSLVETVSKTAEHYQLGSDEDSTTTLIAGMMAEVLSLAIVEADDDFFELGGDSLRGARLFSRLARRTGVDLPVSLLVEARTPATLAAFVRAHESVGWSPIVPIQPNGDLPPLFVAYDGLGQIMNARWLSRELGADQPVYGLRPREVSGVQSRARNIEELARDYVREIQLVRPTGPYFLIGHSFGGILALEIGRLLAESGNKVPLVIMGDSHAPSDTPGEHRKQERAKDWHERLHAGGPTEQIRFIVSRAHMWLTRQISEGNRLAREALARKYVARGRVVPMTLRDEFVTMRILDLTTTYRATPYLGDVLYILATRSPLQSDLDAWRTIVRGNLEVEKLDSNHGDLMIAENAAALAVIVKRAVSRHGSAVPGLPLREVAFNGV
jgi:amino acid adenylation domain-containing protein